MKRWIHIFLLCLLSAVLAGCYNDTGDSFLQKDQPSSETGQTGNEPNISEPICLELSSLLPNWEKTKQLSVVVDTLVGKYSGGNRVYAPANGEETENMLKLLQKIDFSLFSVAEMKSYNRLLEMRMETPENIYLIRLGFISGHTTACMEIKYENETSLLLMGPENQTFWIDFLELYQTICIGDKERSGTVTILKNEESHLISNWLTSRALYILDDFLQQNGTEEEHSEAQYDIRFVFEEKTYYLENSSGKFYREHSNVKNYGQVEIESSALAYLREAFNVLYP